MTHTIAPELRGMDDEDLLGLYLADADDGETRAAVLEVLAGRDRCDRDAAGYGQVRAEWHEQAYSDYLAAEAECRGELLSRDGEAAGVRDGFALWSGPRRLAERYASEELREFWLDHPRVTVTEYAAQRQAGLRAARQDALFGETADGEITEITEAWTDEQHTEDRPGPAVDGPEAAGLRHVSAAGAVRPGRDGQQHARAEAGQVRDTGPVQRGGMMTGTYADDDHAPVDSIHLWGGTEPRLPYGSAVLFVGWRMSGKGLCMAALAAAVTNGAPLPGEESGRDPGDVLMVTAEDDPTEDVAWRLRAAGANLARCHDLTRLPDGSRFKLSATPTWAGHIAYLRAAIGQLVDEGRNPQLVILDPLNAVVGRGTIKTDQGARHVMEQLQDLAKDTGVVVAIVHHFVKSGSIGGSQGLADAARIVYTIKPDPDNDQLKVLHLEKANVLGRTGDLRYSIVEAGHDTRIQWQDDAVIEQQRANWRERLSARRSAAQQPAVPLSRQDAARAGCKHPNSKLGTPRQCGDCPVRNLRGGGASGPLPPAPPVSAAPGAVWSASVAPVAEEGLPPRPPRLIVSGASPGFARQACERSPEARAWAAAGQPLVWEADGRDAWAAWAGSHVFSVRNMASGRTARVV